MVPNLVPIYILHTDHYLHPSAIRLVRADSLKKGLSIDTRNAKFEIKMSSSLPKFKFLKIWKNIEFQISYKIGINKCNPISKAHKEQIMVHYKRI